MRGKKLLGCFGGFTTLVVLVGLLLVWIYGPMLGAGTLGRPIFLVATPHRYATFAFDLAEAQGLYSDSEEFRTARAEAEQKLPDANTLADTHPIIDDVLKAAGGKHSRVLPPEENQPSSLDNSAMPTVKRDGDIVRATVPEFSRGPIAQEYADTLANGLAKEVPDSCGVIVDLRGNTGGDMGPMIAGLSSLLPDGTVMSFKGKEIQDVVVSGSSVSGGGTPITVADSGKFSGPVAVLTDHRTASSGEAALLSFRGLDNARSFGEPTAGYPSGNIVIDMPDGAAILLTTSSDVARTGEEFAEDPIAPDVDTDQPVEEATEWLKQKCS
ncbi:S41 family peptidase [Corynebacterium sp.]|uniref:S41 family peptidase n=1 Tax=Corynebacterium sp. TaxID=1720 RepID=UPI0026DBBB79|nr:S41 family peptidase [Corynebacterium sp.]MDO5076210.1 S41 family peptidase [Corynebacterium sp.]